MFGTTLESTIVGARPSCREDALSATKPCWPGAPRARHPAGEFTFAPTTVASTRWMEFPHVPRGMCSLLELVSVARHCARFWQPPRQPNLWSIHRGIRGTAGTAARGRTACWFEPSNSPAEVSGLDKSCLMWAEEKEVDVLHKTHEKPQPQNGQL